mgnify:CR=1 FL=1
MRVTSKIDSILRQKIIDRPGVILDDPDVMQALIAANETAMGANIVDLRGVAMDRLESRLDRLENTHRGVIAAAYENMAGTNQIQRAVLRLLEAPDFAAFMEGVFRVAVIATQGATAQTHEHAREPGARAFTLQ